MKNLPFSKDVVLAGFQICKRLIFIVKGRASRIFQISVVVEEVKVGDGGEIFRSGRDPAVGVEDIGLFEDFALWVVADGETREEQVGEAVLGIGQRAVEHAIDALHVELIGVERRVEQRDWAPARLLEMSVFGQLQLLADQAAIVVVSGIGSNRQHGRARVFELQLDGLERFLGDLCDLVDAFGIIRIGELDVERIELIIVHGSCEPVVADQARRLVVAHAVDIVAYVTDLLEQGAVLGKFLEVSRAVWQLACLALAVLEAFDDGLELPVLALGCRPSDGR